VISIAAVLGGLGTSGCLPDSPPGHGILTGEPSALPLTASQLNDLKKEEQVAEYLRTRPAPPPFMDQHVERRLTSEPSSVFPVTLYLADDPDGSDSPPPETAFGRSDLGLAPQVVLNGRPSDGAAYDAYLSRETTRIRQAETKRRNLNALQWKLLSSEYGLGSQLAGAINRGDSSAVITVSGQVLAGMAAAERGRNRLRSIGREFSPVGGDGLASALTSVEVSTVATPAGWNGSNIGVWMNDGDGMPITTTPCVNNNRLTVQDFGTQPNETHATQTLCTLMGTATDARVHYAVPTQSCNLRGDVSSFSNPQVFVSSQSNSFGDDGTDYSNCSRDWDNFVYNSLISHFALTQNQASNVRGAAKAYNVFSIGAYDDRTNPVTMANFSNFGDPATSADKPEFVAPGVGLDVGSWVGISGTSFATPIAAGFAADLLEQAPFLRLQPQLLKAYLLVNSVDVDGTNPFGDVDGAGRLDYSNTAFGLWSWWAGANNSWFGSDVDGNGRFEIVVTDSLVAGVTYHTAISWLVLGTYVRANGAPNMDIDLKVRSPSGVSVAASRSVENNYEMVRFTASVSGTYTFLIERWSNSGQGNVRVGFVNRAR
jgi:hypothetical protein